MAVITPSKKRRRRKAGSKLELFELEVYVRSLRLHFDELPRCPSHIYIIRDPEARLYKIGESACGRRVGDNASIRAESQVRQLNRLLGPGFMSEVRKTFSNKRAAQRYEVRLIRRYRRMFGEETLPGNRLHR